MILLDEYPPFAPEVEKALTDIHPRVADALPALRRARFEYDTAPESVFQRDETTVRCVRAGSRALHGAAKKFLALLGPDGADGPDASLIALSRPLCERDLTVQDLRDLVRAISAEADEFSRFLPKNKGLKRDRRLETLALCVASCLHSAGVPLTRSVAGPFAKVWTQVQYAIFGVEQPENFPLIKRAVDGALSWAARLEEETPPST